MQTMGSRGFIIQDENLDAHRKKSMPAGKIMKPANAMISKKAKENVGKIRQPLGDLTNKKQPLALKISPKKHQNVKQEGFNIADEGFLHDHKKCVESQEADLKHSFIDLVFPKCDIVLSDHHKSSNAKVDFEAAFEPKEIDMSEFSDWNMGPSPWNSPPMSPTSPPSPMFVWDLELPEFTLKDFD